MPARANGRRVKVLGCKPNGKPLLVRVQLRSLLFSTQLSNQCHTFSLRRKANRYSLLIIMRSLFFKELVALVAKTIVFF